ncbi:TadE family protein [Streptomyces sp. NPDC005438]|uniref:TadE family protein n=1 Tax=Streptomyces sp. NPDC005438 TaxID=3156880 RepID=UPI0033BB3D68
MAVEFTSIVPIIAAVLVLMWQGALVGYTFMLAGNSADQAARSGSVADPWKGRGQACKKGGEEHLDKAWRDGASIDCWVDGDLVKAKSDLKVPVLFPGAFNLPITVGGEAAATRES